MSMALGISVLGCVVLQLCQLLRLLVYEVEQVVRHRHVLLHGHLKVQQLLSVLALFLALGVEQIRSQSLHLFLESQDFSSVWARRGILFSNRRRSFAPAVLEIALEVGLRRLDHE